jgi:hypothetical protein
MKRIILILLFLFCLKSLYCQENGLWFIPKLVPGFSINPIFSHEVYEEAKNSTNYWGGLGILACVYDLDDPLLVGFSTGIERRHYFKSNQFKHFFISATLAGGCMTDFEYLSCLGLAPGLKSGYKAYLRTNFVLEPFISLSIPLAITLGETPGTVVVFPSITLGTRIGFNKVNEKRYKI